MASPQVLDFEQLLRPISEETPCGENVRWDPVYDEIRKARQEESRDALSEGGDAAQANWPLVVQKATEVLAQRSKDLMIAAHLEEGLSQTNGFAGVRDGFKLINGLIETFWDALFPQIDGEDLEPRAAPIVWLAEADRGSRLPNRIREIGLTPRSGDAVVHSLAFSKSRFAPPKGENEDLETYERRRSEAEGRGKQFEDAIAAIPVDYYRTVWEDIQECGAEIAKLGKVLDDRFGRSAPGVTQLREAVEECGVLVRRILKDKGGLEAEMGEAGDGAEAGATAGAPGVSTGPLKNRADALRRLGEVAAYFRATEPHSPISYLVERAASWGRMPLERLVEELVKDPTARDQIAELLAFQRHSDAAKEE